MCLFWLSDKVDKAEAAWLNMDSTGRPSKQESKVSLPDLCVEANSLSVVYSYTDLFLVVRMEC